VIKGASTKRKGPEAALRVDRKRAKLNRDKANEEEDSTQPL